MGLDGSCTYFSFGWGIVLKKMDRNAFHKLKTAKERSNLSEVEQFVRPALYTRPWGIQSVADIVASG